MSRSAFSLISALILLVGAPCAHAQSAFSSIAVVQHSRMCLEVPSAATASGAQLVQNTCSGRPEQSFRFEPVSGQLQVFTVRPGHATSLCLQAANTNATNGVALVQAGCSDAAATRFRLEGLNRSGQLRLRNLASNRCVDISGASTSTGRFAQLWDCQSLTSGINQNWTLAGAASGGIGRGGPAITAAQIDAARLLQQASFGPTAAEIDQVVSMGSAAWIDNQFARPASNHLQINQAIHSELGPHFSRESDRACEFSWGCSMARHDAWWQVAVTGQDQLRQRVAWALSQMFVISDVSDNVGFSALAMSDYYDTLAVNGLGNYRTLLEEVTLHPLMGRYLGMLQNEKTDTRTNSEPDENFAREVMQLFSIGLVQLNVDGSTRLDAQGRTIPTYDNATISNMARATTGWNFSNATQWWNWERNVGLPGLISNMRAWENYHDTGAKTLLGGVAAPANASAAADLRLALDAIFNHPNVGPFVARHMIQRMVTGNPSPDYIRRVALAFNNNGQNVRGDMRAVVRTVLLDPEARDAAQAREYGYGKVKEPVLRVSALLRAFNAQGQAVASANGATTQPLLRNRAIGGDMAQAIGSSPSVFNYYRPNFQPTGELRVRGLFAPELQIMNEAVAISTLNHMHQRFFQTDRDDSSIPLTASDPNFWVGRYRLDFSFEKPLALTPEALVDRMNLVLMAGKMPPDMRNILIDSTYATAMDDGGGDRVEDLVFLIGSSSQFAVQR